SVADAFDAMNSDRPYRKGLSVDQACAEIEKNSGTQFDPEVTAAFLTLKAEGKINDASNGNGHIPGDMHNKLHTSTP
ncbi:MAG: HD-GYP domain-containing protein, partial [Deltaproteobacteria bacterium]